MNLQKIFNQSLKKLYRISKESLKNVNDCRDYLDKKINNSDSPIYGINTGFGLFSKVVVSKEQLHDLQVNLILSHSSGVGEPLSRPRTRMLLALRTNVLAKGHSGISVQSLKQVIAAFNKDCLPPGAGKFVARVSSKTMGNNS